MFTDDRRQTDIGEKPVFSHSGDLNTWRFDETWESDYSHKTNTFSHDGNVQNLSLNIIFSGRKIIYYLEATISFVVLFEQAKRK